MSSLTCRLVLAASALILSASAHATQVLERDLPSLVNDSAVIILGTVSEKKSEPVPASKGRAQTRITLSVKTVLKSDGHLFSAVAKPLSFLLPGGRLGRYMQVVAGTPELTRGMEVLLMLERNPETNELLVSGFSQGCYVIERNKGREPTAVSDRRGLRLMRRNSNHQLEPAIGANSLDRRVLSDFIATIRVILEKTSR